MNVSVIGLGKLGLPLAAVLAEAGNKVFAYDANQGLLDQLRNKTFQSSEPGLMELLNKHHTNLSIEDTIDVSVLSSELTFIIVPTPSMNDGNFDNQLVVKVLEEIAETLKEKKGFHVIDVVSTVMPGSCNDVFIPLLEKLSGKILNEHFGLCYNPEFIALGSVVKNMQKPDMHLIGASNIKSGELLEEALKSVTGEGVPSRIMNLKEAELVKISVNNFVTTKISFANMLMQIADKLGGVDVDIVTDAIGLDSRIGRKYLRGGTSFGGPCFPRDTRAMSTLLSNLDLSTALPEATSSLNDKHNDFLVEKVLSRIGSEEQVGLIGYSYKPDTSVYEESTGSKLANILVANGKSVNVWEPLMTIGGIINGKSIFFVENLRGLSTCSALVITRVLSQEEIEAVLQEIESGLLLDPWRQISKIQLNTFKPKVSYLPIGREL